MLPAAARADTVNVEVSFTPYPGEVGQATEARTVAGRVELVLNGVPMLDNPLAATRALVMGTGPSGPELSPAFWLPVRGLQPVLRRGPNLLQLRFTPQDGRIHYESQFPWVAMRRERCLERGHAAGVRLAAPALDQVRLITTGSPVVVARGVGPSLFRPANVPGTEARLADLPQDVGFCFAMATSVLFPPQLLLVKGPQGQWRPLD